MLSQGHVEPGETLPTETPASWVSHECFWHLHRGRWKAWMGQSHVLALVSAVMVQNLQAPEMKEHFFFLAEEFIQAVPFGSELPIIEPRCYKIVMGGWQMDG